mgnify:CR=1 FL=1
MSVRHVESLPTVDGGSMQWEFADPGRLLSLLVRDVPQVQGLFAEVGIAKPCIIKRSGETRLKPISWFEHRLCNLCEAMRILITRCIYNVKSTVCCLCLVPITLAALLQLVYFSIMLILRILGCAAAAVARSE